MSGQRWTALVLAGSRGPEDPVARAGGADCKAFVPVAGRPMVERVLAALEASGRVGAIMVALDRDAPVEAEAPGLAERLRDGRARRLDPAPTPSRSVLAAFDALAPGTPLLVVTADHPLLTAAMVTTFLDAASQGGADVAAALAPTSLIDAAYPGIRRTRLKFRDGGYSGCNLFALMSANARRVIVFWGGMEARRKKPARLAMAIGPLTLVGYVLGLLTLRGALRLLGRKAGARLWPVVLRDAEAAIDVDTVEHLRLAEAVLEKVLTHADR